MITLKTRTTIKKEKGQGLCNEVEEMKKKCKLTRKKNYLKKKMIKIGLFVSIIKFCTPP